MRKGKLVRDNIPHLAKREPVTFVELDTHEFIQAAARKLIEESTEVSQAIERGSSLAKVREELGDLRETELALMRALQISEQQLTEARKAKSRKKGAFHRRMYRLD